MQIEVNFILSHNFLGYIVYHLPVSFAPLEIETRCHTSFLNDFSAVMSKEF